MVDGRRKRETMMVTTSVLENFAGPSSTSDASAASIVSRSFHRLARNMAVLPLPPHNDSIWTHCRQMRA